MRPRQCLGLVELLVGARSAPGSIAMVTGVDVVGTDAQSVTNLVSMRADGDPAGSDFPTA